MSDSGTQLESSGLSQHSGWLFVTSGEAILKGALESEVPLELIAGPAEGAFEGLFQAGEDAAIAQLLRQHGTGLQAVPDASRAVTLSLQAARSSRRALAVVPNDQLDRTMSTLEWALQTPLDGRGAMCLAMEDDPAALPTACPRRAAARLGMACIEPAQVSELPEAVELALRLSRAGASPIAMVVHASILNSADTIEAKPNRVIQSVDALLARRRRPRGARGAESGGMLRLARRLEINRFRSVPSPGERVATGFIVVGPAASALDHVLHAVGLVGRIPTLRLTLVHPLDDPLIERMLTRCEQVVVLEPRPGSIEAAVQAAAESLRRRAERPATVWGGQLPPADDGQPQGLAADEAVHPSTLARRIIHLLHAVRPTLKVASKLTPNLPVLANECPSRGSPSGAAAAIAFVRRVLIDVDQWLRDREPEPDDAVGPSALAIDGVIPSSDDPARRLVWVETWDDRRFFDTPGTGIAALRQAAMDARSWLLVICDLTSSGDRSGSEASSRDLERIISGAIPGSCAERVRVELGDLADAAGLRELMRKATLREGCTVLLARDGPPAQFSRKAIERSLREVDRLGFESVQLAAWPADRSCAVRDSAWDRSDPAPAAHAVLPKRNHFSRQRDESGRGGGLRFRVRPLWEQVEVVRVRAPMTRWKQAASARLPVPTPLHARDSLWRAHVAGCRSFGMGVAGIVLCKAGRLMGYHVRATCDPTRIAAGVSAWMQVMFTRPRTEEEPAPWCAMIPYGEADVLIGIDVGETLRAIDGGGPLRVASADRTHAVVNLTEITDAPTPVMGEFDTGQDVGEPSNTQNLVPALAACAFSCVSLEFAAACRNVFHTDRVVDLVTLGAAYQSGLVPISLEAAERALRDVEALGFARAVEAFAFGRDLAARPELSQKAREQQDDDIKRVVRRTIRSVARSPGGGFARAGRFRSLVSHCLGQVPGLAETEAGRSAQRDLVVGLRRCLAWGGLDYADWYARLISELYGADRGDRGRALTRWAILPLAETMLPRDPFYIASMATSLEHRRRTRQQLNVKPARGDQLERRYLTRIEVDVLGWEIRGDVRTSDWPAQLVSLLSRWIPQRHRGTALERQIREYVIEFVQRATRAPAAEYDSWEQSLRRLHERALEGELHDAALSELRMLIEPVVRIESDSGRSIAAAAAI